MSTRSCIARKVDGGWTGVYHHSDGYPTGLGCYLFRLLHHKFGGDLERFLNYAIDQHPGGWSHIFPGGVVGPGEWWQANAMKSQCHCHGYFKKRDGAIDMRHTSEYTDHLSIEWVYIFDPQARKMLVLEHKEVAHPELGEKATCIKPWTLKQLDGSVEQMGNTYYVHRQVAEIDLDGPEPEWWAIEGKLAPAASWVDSVLPPVNHLPKLGK